MNESEKKYYIDLDQFGHRKYFGSYKEARNWVNANPIVKPGKKNGTYHIYPSDTTGMGGHKKGSARLSYATKIGKEKRKQSRRMVVNTGTRRN